MRAQLTKGEYGLLILLSILLGWEAVLISYKISELPFGAVDFFQHYFLAFFLQRGGTLEDPSWPMRVESMIGLRLPPDLEQTAPLLPYQLLVLPLFYGLARLPMTTAYITWLGICVLIVGGIGYRLARAIGANPVPILFTLAIWPGIWQVLILGNVDILVWALMSFGMINLFRGRLRWGGFWIGWATMFKGFPLFAAMPWLTRKSTDVLKGVIGGIAVGTLWGTIWGGWTGWGFFLRHLPEYGQAMERFMHGNNSLLGLLWGLFGPPFRDGKGTVFHGLFYPVFPLPVRLLYGLGALLVALVIGIWAWRRQGMPSWAEGGVWLSMGIFLWPMSWINYHIYLFAPLAALVHRRRALRPTTRHLLLFSLVLLAPAFSYWVLNSIAAPYMAASLVLGITRIVLIALFIRAASELDEKRTPKTSITWRTEDEPMDSSTLGRLSSYGGHHPMDHDRH